MYWLVNCSGTRSSGHYLFRGGWDQDAVFQLGERLLDVKQHT